jgi:hypothetical protein
MKKVSHHLVVTALAVIVSLSTTAAFAAPPLRQATPAKKEAAKPYPLTTCIVSDDKLGDMGRPVVFDYKGQVRSKFVARIAARISTRIRRSI